MALAQPSARFANVATTRDVNSEGLGWVGSGVSGLRNCLAITGALWERRLINKAQRKTKGIRG